MCKLGEFYLVITYRLHSLIYTTGLMMRKKNHFSLEWNIRTIPKFFLFSCPMQRL